MYYQYLLWHLYHICLSNKQKYLIYYGYFIFIQNLWEATKYFKERIFGARCAWDRWREQFSHVCFTCRDSSRSKVLLSSKCFIFWQSIYGFWSPQSTSTQYSVQHSGVCHITVRIPNTWPWGNEEDKRTGGRVTTNEAANSTCCCSTGIFCICRTNHTR